MRSTLEKVFLGAITFFTSILVVQLVPISRQSANWNNCLEQTSEWLINLPALKQVNDKGRKALAVSICNGAVHEPKIKSTESFNNKSKESVIK